MGSEKINPHDPIQESQFKLMPSDESYKIVLGVKLKLKNPTKESLVYYADIELTDKDGFHLARRTFIPNEVNSLGDSHDPHDGPMYLEAGAVFEFRGSVEFFVKDYEPSDRKPKARTGWQRP